jgi:hypothetical protein
MEGVQVNREHEQAKFDHRILEVLEHSLHELREIRRELKPRTKTLTAAIAVRFTGTGEPIMNNILTLNVGQTAQASILPLLTDGVTPSGGTLSAVSYTFSDPSATVVLNPDGLTATVTGVAASAGPISGAASCTVGDTDGAVSTWTQAFTVQTNAPVPPSQITQSIAVQFSTPTP